MLVAEVANKYDRGGQPFRYVETHGLFPCSHDYVQSDLTCDGQYYVVCVPYLWHVTVGRDVLLGTIWEI